MAKTKKPAAPAPPNPYSATIHAEAGKTDQRVLAEVAVAGKLSNAIVARNYSTAFFGKETLSLDECARALNATVVKVKSGDLGMAETMLVSQAVALDAIFTSLAHRAFVNLGEYLEATERYLRLAFKAQSQTRTTLEALAEIKNPRPVAFVKQANIAAGHQQVNNGTALPAPRAEGFQTAPNELLEASNGEQRLDTGATVAAGRADPVMAPLGAIDGAAQR